MAKCSSLLRCCVLLSCYCIMFVITEVVFPSSDFLCESNPLEFSLSGVKSDLWFTSLLASMN